MKKLICHLSLIALLLLSPGCGLNSISRTEKTEPSSTTAVAAPQDTGSESSYYHFSKYEIQKDRGELDGALKELTTAVKADPSSIFLKKELIALHLYLKDTVKAMDTAQTLVDEHQENPELLIILAKLKQMNKQEIEAREIYQKALQLAPDNKNVYLILGRMYMENRNTEEAFRLYSKMADHFPDSYTAHFFLGKIHLEKQNPEYAEKEFLKTIELNQELVEPRFQLIGIYQSLDQESEEPDPRIISLYKKILAIEKQNLRANLELSLYYHHHGSRELAARRLAETGKKNAAMMGISMMAAKEFIGSKRYKDAAIIFSGMVKGAPDDSTLNYFAGVSFDALKQYNKAIRYFLKIKNDSEHYKKAIVHVAFLYNENDQLDKAIDFLEQKHGEMPEDIDIMLYLGSFYEEKNALPQALEILTRGAELAKDNPSLLFRLGVVQDKSDMKEDCISTMQRVIALEPENASALNYLGYTWAELGQNLDEAATLIKKALTIKPQDGFITDSLGWIYFKQGLYIKAIETLEKAAELTKFDPIITEHLGDAYEKNNMLEKALKMHLKTRSKLKNDNPELIRKIERIEKLLNGHE